MSTLTAFWNSLASLRTVIQNCARSVAYAFRAHRLATVGLFLLIPLTGASSFVASFAMGRLVDTLTTHPTEQGILIGVLFLVGGRFLESLGTIRGWCSNILYLKMQERIEMDFNRKRSELDIALIERPATQDMIKRISEQGRNSVRTLASMTSSVIENVYEVVFALVIFASNSWWLVPIVVLSTAPRIFVEIRFGDRVWGIYHGHSEEARHYSTVAGQFSNTSGLIEMKLNQAAEWFLARGQALFNSFYSKHEKNNNDYSRNTILARLFNEAVLGVAFLILAREVFFGEITVGTFTFLAASMLTLQSSLQGLYSQFGMLTRDNRFVTDYFEFFNITNTLPQKASPHMLADVPITIEFSGVSFTYPDSTAPALHDVSFVIKPGEALALVGLNGAGKTTLVKLLARFYDPTEGRILVNGIDLREIDIESWREKLAILFQDFQSYRFLAKESIAVGRTSIPHDESKVRDAAERREAASFIEKFDKKYDAQLGKHFTNGEELSGGQWQKLAIARTLYRNAAVIVLDEPTSAVDAEAEAKIFERLEKDHANASMLLISHRFSTVRHADNIIVLEHGAVIEHGTHQKLLKEGGRYAELFKIQAKGYT